jgi:hypothetical protein
VDKAQLHRYHHQTAQGWQAVQVANHLLWIPLQMRCLPQAMRMLPH